jgi:hypothetical protein
VKKLTGKWLLLSTIAAVCGFVSPTSLSAIDNTAQDECVRELLLSYFPEPIVNETLKKFNVPQDKWPAIVKALGQKDKEVVKLVEEKAAKMTPNPLKDAKERQAAVKLFRDTLLEVFSDSMKANGMTDTSQFQAMLDDIQQQKAKKFAMCMEKHKADSKSNQASSANGDDEDEDDEDSDDDYDDEDEDETEAETKDAAAKPATTAPVKSTK